MNSEVIKLAKKWSGDMEEEYVIDNDVLFSITIPEDNVYEIIDWAKKFEAELKAENWFKRALEDYAIPRFLINQNAPNTSNLFNKISEFNKYLKSKTETFPIKCFDDLLKLMAYWKNKVKNNKKILSALSSQLDNRIWYKQDREIYNFNIALDYKFDKIHIEGDSVIPYAGSSAFDFLLILVSQTSSFFDKIKHDVKKYFNGKNYNIVEEDGIFDLIRNVFTNAYTKKLISNNDVTYLNPEDKKTKEDSVFNELAYKSIYDIKGLEKIISETFPNIYSYPLVLKALVKFSKDEGPLNSVIKNFLIDLQKNEKQLLSMTFNDILNILEAYNYYTADLNIIKLKYEQYNLTILALAALAKYHHNTHRSPSEIYKYLISKFDKDIVNKALGVRDKLLEFIKIENPQSLPTDKANFINKKNISDKQFDLFCNVMIAIHNAEKSKNWSVLSENSKDIYLADSILTLNNLSDEEKELIEESKNIKKIPEIHLLNTTIDDVKFRVIEDGSIEHLTVGAITECCQRIGGAGEDAAIDSLKNPKAGVLVCEWNNLLLSQSYFHYVIYGERKGYILDNVEWNERNVKISGKNLNKLYHKLALWAKDNLKIDFFECGTDYNKLDNSQFSKSTWTEDPREFAVDDPYSDWDNESSLDLLSMKFDPNYKKDEEDEEAFQKIEKRPPSEYSENMTRDDFKKEIFNIKNKLFKKTDNKENKKQIRRQQENILKKLNIPDAEINKVLSLPIVKTLTQTLAEKELNGESTDYTELKEYLSKKKLLMANYILSLSDLFLKLTK